MARALSSEALNGRLTTVKLLVALGADVNPKDMIDCTPLCDAARSGNLEIIQLLLEKGADPNASTYSPLEAAVDGLEGDETTEQVRLMRVRCLLDGGVAIDGQSAWRYTALATAAKKGYSEIVTYLLEQGADRSIPNGSGMTPLIVTAWQSQPTCVNPLFEAGADVNAVDGSRRTALMFACGVLYSLSLEIARMLLDKGADKSLTDKEGHTALFYAERWLSFENDKAKRNELIEIVKLLGGTPPESLFTKALRWAERYL